MVPGRQNPLPHFPWKRKRDTLRLLQPLQTHATLVQMTWRLLSEHDVSLVGAFGDVTASYLAVNGCKESTATNI